MFQPMKPASEEGGTDTQGGPVVVQSLPPAEPDNVNGIPPEGGMTESQSWATVKAQEVFQKTGSWSPDRPYPDDPHDNRHNSQTVEMRVMGRDGHSDTEPSYPMDGHGRTHSMPRLSADNQPEPLSMEELMPAESQHLKPTILIAGLRCGERPGSQLWSASY
ncbi:unnamed protein product [Boreogadus saida]